MIPVGELVEDRFRVISQVGEGGFGSVYLAEQVGMNRKVALKFVHMADSDDPELLARFEQEGRILASLNHKNIVTCYAYGFWRNKIPYLALEYLEGKTLFDLLKEQKSLPWELALSYGIEVAAALRELHSHGIIHRDLKPENIIITADGTLKIIDFGLVSIDGQKLTKTGHVVGSLLYLSPEQAYARKPSCASDIYSLGCVLYQLIAGRPPFESDIPGDILQLHASGEPKPLSQSLPDLPASVSNIVMRAMQKDPANRFASASELAEDMQAALQNKAVQTPLIASTGATSHRERQNALIRKPIIFSLVIATLAFAIYKVNEVIETRSTADKLAVQIEDELQRSGLLNLPPNRAPYKFIREEDSSNDKQPSEERQKQLQQLQFSHTVQSRRLSHFNKAVELASDARLSNDLRGAFLLAESHSWNNEVMSLEQTVCWLENCASVLSHKISRSQVRAELEQTSDLLANHAEGRMYQDLQPKLFNAIQGTSEPLSDCGEAILLERLLSSRLRNLTPVQNSFSDFDVKTLFRYVVLLAGTSRAQQASVFIEPFMNAKALSENEHFYLTYARSIAQTSMGELDKSLATLQDVQRLANSSMEASYCGNAPFLLLAVKAGVTHNFEMVDKALDLAISMPFNRGCVPALEIHRLQAYLAGKDQKLIKAQFEKIIKSGALDPRRNPTEKGITWQLNQLLLGILHGSNSSIELGRLYEHALPYSKGAPFESEVVFALAQRYQNSGQFDLLLPVLNQGLTSRNMDSEFRWWCLLSTIHALTGLHKYTEIGEKVRMTQKLIANCPRDRQWVKYQELGQHLVKIPGQLPLAFECARKALSCATADKVSLELMQAHDLLSKCYVLAGDIPAGNREYKLSRLCAKAGE